jgi:hypothetical protein
MRDEVIPRPSVSGKRLFPQHAVLIKMKELLTLQETSVLPTSPAGGKPFRP